VNEKEIVMILNREIVNKIATLRYKGIVPAGVAGILKLPVADVEATCAAYKFKSLYEMTLEKKWSLN